MGLTILNQWTDEVEPFLAEEWDVSEDGLTYTFTLREDVPWVQYNTSTGEVDLAQDAEGKPRFVNAYDVEYSVKRTIDPATASDYAYILYIIKNAQAVNKGKEDFGINDIGVTAIDEYTVEFELESPAGYFPNIVGLWIASPVPQWTIEEAGDKWTEPGTIVTNGPYVMTEWIHGTAMKMKKNPHWPDEDNVQIDEIHFVMVEKSIEFTMYEIGELDLVGIPLEDADRIKTDPVLSAEYDERPQPCTEYYGFINNKPPMDDVRVRKAFSMSIDKQSLVDNIGKGGLILAGQFAPEGIFGAPEMGTVGLPYDPIVAKQLLDEYLTEKNMTVDELDISLMHNRSEGLSRVAEAIWYMWFENLGVDVSVQSQEWRVYLDTVRKATPLVDAPHIFRMGWCADYPDENNWVHEVFNADAGANRLRRGCVDDVCTEVELQEFDLLTEQAKISQDPQERIDLYFEAEKLLSEVEVAYIPLVFFSSRSLTKPYLTRTYPTIAAPAYWMWKIDWEAKKAATGQ